MRGTREVRLAVTGALLLVLIGAIQGCGDESPTAPSRYHLQADGKDTIATPNSDCVIIKGVLVCD